MMESSQTYALYLEPMLNSYYKSYQNILTISHIPQGPLGAFITRLSAPKLSSFQTISYPLPMSGCLLAISRYPGKSSMKYIDNFMYAADIPTVIGYLETNGYKIMTDITNLAFNGPVDFGSYSPGTSYSNRKLVFMFRYENPLLM